MVVRRGAIAAGAVLLGLAPMPFVVAAAQPQSIEQAGDAAHDAALERAVVARTAAYFKARDARGYDRAYAMIADSMRAYLTPELFRDSAARFVDEAGRPGGVEVHRLSWYRDPPDAPQPGLYVAADFTAHYANIELMCGYLMWRQGADGGFELVREEQNFVDRRAAAQMAPERRRELPRLFNCLGPEARADPATPGPPRGH